VGDSDDSVRGVDLPIFGDICEDVVLHEVTYLQGL
jgi:hypothetical protein